MLRKHFKRPVSRLYEKLRLNRYGYDVGVDYDAIAVDAILDIQKYLMKKSNMIQKYLDLLKNVFYRINNFIKCKFVSCNSAKIYFNY